MYCFPYSILLVDVLLWTFWGNYHFEFVDASSIGRSRGLVSIWDPSSFIKSRSFSMDHALIVEGEWVVNHLKCYMVNVYAPKTKR